MALTGNQAIAALSGFIVFHEVTCDEGQMLSHVFDRLMQRAPLATTIATVAFSAITTAHLLNALDRYPRLDPYAGFGYAVVATIKSRWRQTGPIRPASTLTTAFAASAQASAAPTGFPLLNPHRRNPHP